MKGLFISLMFLASSVSITADAEAQGKEPIFFKAVTPCDVLSGVGLYVKDVGQKTIQGTGVMLKGAGRVITSPFRAKFYWPQPKMFRYERGYWVPPKLERLPTTPPVVEPEGILGDPAPPPKVDKNPELLPSDLIYPLHREIDNQEFITLVEFKF